MATFQSQINILAAANCGIHSRLNQLEKSRLEVNYNDTFTTIKDTHDDAYITINNLGYNAYDAVLIMKNDSLNPTTREYHLMGFDGQNLDLGKNTEIRAKIGKAMEAQTMKLLELTNMTNERELLRWDFECKFDSSDVFLPLDETDFSIGYPILIETTDEDDNKQYSAITKSNNLVTNDEDPINYYTYDNTKLEPYTPITDETTINETTIVYKDFNGNKIPIGFSNLKDTTTTSYCIKINQSVVDTFTERLTITSNPTCKLSEYVSITYGDGEPLDLSTNDKLIILGYSDETIYIRKDTNIISFKLKDTKILRLATSFKDDGIPVQFCYINIKKENMDNLKVNDKDAIINTTDSFNVSFPWGTIEEQNIFKPDTTNDTKLTKIDGGHLWTDQPGKVLDEVDAPYSNINIINNMKPLQFDIKDETEGTAPPQA